MQITLSKLLDQNCIQLNALSVLHVIFRAGQHQDQIGWDQTGMESMQNIFLYISVTCNSTVAFVYDKTK